MKIRPQHIRLHCRDGGACSIIVLAVSLLVTLAFPGCASAATVLQDDFSGDSGSITSGSSTMTFAPQVGSGAVTATSDNAQITSSLGVGGSSALQYFDTAAGNSIITYTPSTALKTGTANLSFDLSAQSGSPGPIDTTRPMLNIGLYSNGQLVNVGFFYFNNLVAISDGLTYFHSTFLGGTSSEDAFYHFTFALDMNAETVTMSVSGPGISMTTPANAFASTWDPSQGITGITFASGNTEWGYNNDPNPPIYNTGAYGVLDNVSFASPVPEPASVLLFLSGLGAAAARGIRCQYRRKGERVGRLE